MPDSPEQLDDLELWFRDLDITGVPDDVLGSDVDLDALFQGFEMTDPANPAVGVQPVVVGPGGWRKENFAPLPQPCL